MSEISQKSSSTPEQQHAERGQKKQQQRQQLSTSPAVREEVVYYSFSLPHHLAQAFAADGRADARLADIEEDCQCSILVNSKRHHQQQQQQQQQHRHQRRQRQSDVVMEVLMDESGTGSFAESVRRLADLVRGLGGQWRIRRIIKKLSLANGAKTYRVEQSPGHPSPNTSGGGECTPTFTTPSHSSCGGGGGGGGGGSGSGSVVMSFADEAEDGHWSLYSMVSPFLELEQPPLSPELTKHLWLHAVKLLAEATRRLATEVAAGEIISFSAYTLSSGAVDASLSESVSNDGDSLLCATTSAASAGATAEDRNFSHEPEASLTLLVTALLCSLGPPEDTIDNFVRSSSNSTAMILMQAREISSERMPQSMAEPLQQSKTANCELQLRQAVRSRQIQSSMSSSRTCCSAASRVLGSASQAVGECQHSVTATCDSQSYGLALQTGSVCGSHAGSGADRTCRSLEQSAGGTAGNTVQVGSLDFDAAVAAGGVDIARRLSTGVHGVHGGTVAGPAEQLVVPQFDRANLSELTLASDRHLPECGGGCNQLVTSLTSGLSAGVGANTARIPMQRVGCMETRQGGQVAASGVQASVRRMTDPCSVRAKVVGGGASAVSASAPLPILLTATTARQEAMTGSDYHDSCSVHHDVVVSGATARSNAPIGALRASPSMSNPALDVNHHTPFVVADATKPLNVPAPSAASTSPTWSSTRIATQTCLANLQRPACSVGQVKMALSGEQHMSTANCPRQSAQLASSAAEATALRLTCPASLRPSTYAHCHHLAAALTPTLTAGLPASESTSREARSVCSLGGCRMGSMEQSECGPVDAWNLPASLGLTCVYQQQQSQPEQPQTFGGYTLTFSPLTELSRCAAAGTAAVTAVAATDSAAVSSASHERRAPTLTRSQAFPGAESIVRWPGELTASGSAASAPGSPLTLPLIELHQRTSGCGSDAAHQCQVLSLNRLNASAGRHAMTELATETVVSLTAACNGSSCVDLAGAEVSCRHGQEAVCQVRLMERLGGGPAPSLSKGTSPSAVEWQRLVSLIASTVVALEWAVAWPTALQAVLRMDNSGAVATTAATVSRHREPEGGAGGLVPNSEVMLCSELIWESRRRVQLTQSMLN